MLARVREEQGVETVADLLALLARRPPPRPRDQPRRVARRF
jgi:hypothetical protein